MTTKRPDTSDFSSLFLNNIPLMDVRAPVEFNKGAFPLSENHPLMDDDERAKVGTCYKRQGRDAAVALGHRLVKGDLKEQRLQAWTAFTQQHPDGYLYCFRGGERSHLVQAWLKERGIDYPLIEGGYKAMRTFLIEQLEDVIASCNIIILSGKTGTGKTRLLTRLSSHIDLEGLANHRGSSFGRRIGGQPSQIDFENLLAIKLMQARQKGINTLILEDESKLIGRCCLPPELKEKMQAAPIMLLEEDLETRVQITFEEYINQNLQDNINAYGPEQGFRVFAEELIASLDRISRRLGGVRHQALKDTMTHALEQQKAGDNTFHKLWIRELLRDYYDPMYDYQLQQKSNRIIARGNHTELEQATPAMITQVESTITA